MSHPASAVAIALLATFFGAASFAQTPQPAQRAVPSTPAPASTVGPAANRTLPQTSTPTAEMRPGEGIGSVEVGIRKRPGGQIAATTRTDAQGNFTFTNLPAGTYDISITRPAQPDPTAKSFFESRSNTARIDVSVRPGKSGGTNPLIWTWTPASGEVVAGSSVAAQREQKPAGLEVGVGDTVAGRMTVATNVGKGR